MITRKELIKKYIDFFKSKNHKEIPNSSLLPEGDPTVLFTTAGMHPLVPYLLGLEHPLGKRLCNVQRCIRTTDIEAVGDASHHTFFEMLGNWSLGDYFKEDAIKFSFEFLTKVLKIPKSKISVTCFRGDDNIAKDEESASIWKKIGIIKVKFLGKEDNWWGPAGLTGPCGPDTEMFYNGLEIWNDVFMQYNKDINGNFLPLNQKNVDTGMGVERVLAVLNSLKDNYLSEVWKPVIEEIEKLSKKKYKGNEKEMRIIADHIKASVFILADGVSPGNSGQGYVLRRLIRRAVKYAKELGIKESVISIAEPVFEIYKDYSHLTKNKKQILGELSKEEEKFRQTLQNGINQFKKMAENKSISGKEAFLLYQSYGFPPEMIEEEAKKSKIRFSMADFEEELRKHQELSRTASAGQFKSGLADSSEETTKLHTASHLLLEALRIVLKDKEINQKGSNITPERLRLDFNFPRKLEDNEIKAVENLVNEKIKQGLNVKRMELTLNEAKKTGARGVFEHKYGDGVSIYIIEDFSKEICTGPHVTNTSEIGHFKITKEESSGSGVRRIKAVVE